MNDFKASKLPLVVCIVLLGLCGLLANAVAEEVELPQTPEDAREVIRSLAKEGTKDSYEELKLIFRDSKYTNLLFEGNDGFAGGYYEGVRAIREMLGIIGKHQNEASYQLLLIFLNSDYENNEFTSSSYSALINSLLMYRETKEADLTKLLNEELRRVFASRKDYEVDHKFLFEDGVTFDQTTSNYFNKDGRIIHKGRLFDEAVSGTIMQGLYLLDNVEAYGAIKGFLTSWMGRETVSALEFSQLHLKKRRYDLPVIDIYEAMMRDTHYSITTRSDFVKHFFDNSVSHFVDVDDPENTFAQIDSANEEALLRMLDVADYALSLDFLPTETGDLVFKKRAEIIDRLVAMGYSREELNKVDDTEAASDQVNREANRSEPVTEKPAEVKTTEPVGEPAQQPSQWWLWLIGAVVVVGGIALAVRRKN